MIPLAALCLALVAFTAVYVYARYRGCTVAEYIVDLMHRKAMRAIARAQAGDAALCRYREVSREISAAHVAQYQQQAQEWAQERE